ncbi:DUF4164 family protein [uncultured Cohaesibacter sp.]|uniref:DUF4164 family protein n=1 Tax=uncultured Cohaesibacter sp. TaxID=1002546 RepID=UPI0029C8DD71|nr:DUF4164 family protein [uncultured Cohaesibacter sp.]
MGEKPGVSEALVRLDRAIAALEEAVDKQQEKALSVKTLRGDLQRLSAERSDLTTSLEQAQSRSEKLESANVEVSRRLGAAMESVRAVLEQHGG